MRVTKCDFCNQEIKGSPIVAGQGFLGRADLCQECGAPVLDFVRNKKFTKDIKQVKVHKRKK